MLFLAGLETRFIGFAGFHASVVVGDLRPMSLSDFIVAIPIGVNSLLAGVLP